MPHFVALGLATLTSLTISASTIQKIALVTILVVFSVGTALERRPSACHYEAVLCLTGAMSCRQSSSSRQRACSTLSQPAELRFSSEPNEGVPQDPLWNASRLIEEGMWREKMLISLTNSNSPSIHEICRALFGLPASRERR